MGGEGLNRSQGRRRCQRRRSKGHALGTLSPAVVHAVKTFTHVFLVNVVYAVIATQGEAQDRTLVVLMPAWEVRLGASIEPLRASAVLPG